MKVREFESPYMTAHEVAGLLRVNDQTVYRLIRDARLPAFKMGSYYRFHREAVMGWIAARSVGGKENGNG